MFDIFCHIWYFPHLLKSFSNFECTESNFLTEETAALRWNVGVFPATSRENLGKILCEHLVGIKTHSETCKLTEINWLTFSESFPWKFSGSIEQKIGEIRDKARIGSGRDYKAWLIWFTVFKKKMSVARKLIQTIFSHRHTKKLWKAMKLIFDNTDEKHLKAIAFIKRKRDNRVVYITTKINFSTLADKEQWLITWDLRSFSDERNSAGLNEASRSSTASSQNAEINREWVSMGDFSFQRDTIGGWLKICARLGYCSMICQCFMRIVLRFGVAELQVVTNGKMSFVFCYEEP